jgi:mRNA-degrading endonuclease RelE of RelBE toxin-antitoxin system
MAWIVEVSDKALKHLEKFERKMQAKLLNIIEMFKTSPFPKNCDIKKLEGAENVFRLRKGKIRILDIDVRGRIY